MKNIATLMASASLMALYGPVFAKRGGDEGAEAPDVTENVIDEAPVAAEKKESNSIVPRGWKSKNDALKNFLDEQSSGKEGFEYPAFFALMRRNEVPEEQVAKYEGQVAENRPGAKGRAVMTLRNILVPIARKRGHLIRLDGSTVEIELPKPAVSGAAATAKESAAEKQDAA